MAGLTSFANLTRIQPFAGLIIDPATWGTAHEYHRLHRRLHALTFHHSGLVQGLDVLPTDPPGDAVIVTPGIAVDADGEVIVLAAPERVALDGRSGVVYLALAYQEQAPVARDGQPQDEQESRGRMVETLSIEVLDTEPEAPKLELGRIALAKGKRAAGIVAARNPWAPEPGEIDDRHRMRTAAAVGEVSAALVSAGPMGPDTDHVAGFSNLIEACAAAGVHARPRFVATDSLVPEADLLYVTGAPGVTPSEERLAEIRTRLDRGAWLFADGCGRNDAFEEAFHDLADTLTVASVAGEAEALETERAALHARYIFGVAPDGAAPGEVKWGPRMLVSGRDYGCAWRGQASSGPLPRACIRDALEFGVNLAASASQLARAS